MLSPAGIPEGVNPRPGPSRGTSVIVAKIGCCCCQSLKRGEFHFDALAIFWLGATHSDSQSCPAFLPPMSYLHNKAGGG